MKRGRMSRWWLGATLLLTMALVLAACGPAATTEAPKPTDVPKPTITLAANPWDGSRANVAVAKILLEKQLGYTVEVVEIEENTQFPALAKGDLHAVLEIWPSGHAQDYEEYIKTGKAEDLGQLGVVGQINWYVPTYMLKDHPELATWEGFQNPDNAAMFKTAETGDAGQFLAGDSSWVQYDADIIKNLGMNFQVIQSGSEQAQLAALDAAYSKQAPFLFYFWTPHPALAKYDLTPVKLPDYSDVCYAKADSGGVDCAYPPDVLYKAAWAGLKDAAPDAYQFLKNFNYTNKDQISMLGDILVNGKTPEEAAQAWVDANQSVWSAWVTNY